MRRGRKPEREETAQPRRIEDAIDVPQPFRGSSRLRRGYGAQARFFGAALVVPPHREHQHADKGDGEQKCRPAARMLNRVLGDDFGGEFRARFVGVDGLVLRAVIAKQPLHVWQSTDQPDVSDENGKTNDAFDQVDEEGLFFKAK